MKLKNFTFITAWDWIVLIPTIQLIRKDPVFTADSFIITIHWLGWHFRWLWLREG